MPKNYYQINNRSLTIFSELSNELTFRTNKNYLFDLSFLSVLQVSGDRAGEFLQGQLSCDIREVTNKQMRQGIACNLQGRILAMVDVIYWDPYGFQLIVPSDLRSKIQTSLENVAKLSHVNLHYTTEYQLLGFYLQNPDEQPPIDLEFSNQRYQFSSQPTACAFCLGDNVYVLLIPHDQASTIIDAFSQRDQWRGSLAWHQLCLKHKNIQIYPESRGLFLPHRLGLHTAGYLSFNKGCYKGQEIIARTHYRAKLKHELRLFSIKTTEPLQSGQRLFDVGGHTEIGELVDFCPLDHHNFLIAASIIFDHPLTVHIENQKEPVDLVPV